MKEAHFIFGGHELWQTTTKVADWLLLLGALFAFVASTRRFSLSITTIVRLVCTVFYSCWTDTTAENCFSNIETLEWYTLFDVTMGTTLYITWGLNSYSICVLFLLLLLGILCGFCVRFATNTHTHKPPIISIALNSLIAWQFLIAPFALANAGTPLSSHQISIVYTQRLAKI